MYTKGGHTHTYHAGELAYSRRRAQTIHVQVYIHMRHNMAALRKFQPAKSCPAIVMNEPLHQISPNQLKLR